MGWWRRMAAFPKNHFTLLSRMTFQNVQDIANKPIANTTPGLLPASYVPTRFSFFLVAKQLAFWTAGRDLE